MPIPLERYLNVRSAYSPWWSADGRQFSFVSNTTGVPQLWTADSAGGWPEQRTFGPDRVFFARCSPTAADRLVFARDRGGDENMQLFLLDGDASEEHRLTTDDGAMHFFRAWSPDGRFIAVAANRRKRARYDVYLLNVETAEEYIVWENESPGFVYPLQFSPDGTRLLIQFAHGSVSHDLYEITLADRTLRHLTPHQGDIYFGSPVYGEYGSAVYCACDAEGEFSAVVRIDLADLSQRQVVTPEWDAGKLAGTADGRSIAWVTNVEGMSELTLLDTTTGETRAARGLPPGTIAPSPTEVSGMAFSPRGDRLAFSFSGSDRPLDVWTWDLEDDLVRPLTRSSHAAIPASAFASATLIRYETFDGRMIPAWYYRAPRSASRPSPVLIIVHGGPESQAHPVFQPLRHYLLSRDFSILEPNVRRSTGYGKTYTHLDDVEKRLDAVADLAYARHWLAAQADVDQDHIGVYGGSYGGFMVLAALTMYPDLWAAGVDIVGISNFVTFLENTSAYRRSSREIEYGSLERDREVLERISPIHQIHKIRAPLIVIHGANDPRVPLGEAEQVVASLRDRGVAVEFLVYPDEGHGLTKLPNILDAYPRVVAFLNRHLAAPEDGSK